MIYLIFLISLPIACKSGSLQLYHWTNNNATLLTPYNYETLNPSSYTVFIVHGWTENGFRPGYIKMAQNYYTFYKSNINIIIVDYKKIACGSYFSARKIVKKAGTLLGDKIVELLKLNIIEINNIHLYGHSLGPHVCGQAAYVVKKKYKQLIPRISATDPAGPLFRSLRILSRWDPLQKNVTKMLDITHTSWLLGTVWAFGHVDTYIQGNSWLQPECSYQLQKDDSKVMETLLWCNHRTARAYFTASILKCFLQDEYESKNKSQIIYGEHMPLNAKEGVYQIRATNKKPYMAKTIECH